MNSDPNDLPAGLEALSLGSRGNKRDISAFWVESAAPVEKRQKVNFITKKKLPATFKSTARDARVLQEIS